MKYCPYCGANLVDGAAFCLECGERLPVIKKPDVKSSQRKKEKTVKEKKNLKREEKPTDRREETVDDSYDGYYDDRIPSDLNEMENKAEHVDFDIVKRIIFIIAGVILVIALCVLVMYIL